MHQLNYREQRGIEIATGANLERKGKRWIVPSQNGKGRYSVWPDKDEPSCTCPDHEEGGHKCKHIWAVEYVLRRQVNRDGSMVVSEVVTFRPACQPTYPQNWKAYNAAQTGEKDQFLDLLHDLCSGVPEPQRQKMGRPPLPIKDQLFSACFKVYSTVSARRFMSDLRAAHAKGYLSKTPHFNSVLNVLDDPDTTRVLQDLITESSLPLSAIEIDFACDSSGFTASRFHRWYDHKYGAVNKQHGWVKCHLMCGVRTNIVTAVEIRDKDASDTKLLPALVDTTAKNFKLNEVSADKGYGSLKNFEAIANHGAVPYIAFKSIHTGRGGGLWAKMFHLFQYNREEFLRHYHKRSNVETTFSMIKAKFLDHVRSKTDVAMVNEVLCKIICHNLCVVIQEMHELGVNSDFWSKARY